MNVEYYKDAQSVAEAIHDYRWNVKFESDDAKAKAEKEVRAKYLDFVNKWFDAVCDARRDYEGDDGFDEALTTIHIDVSERLTWLFNELIYQRRRGRNKRRATELLVE
jgi:hypothetical protein